MELKLRNIPEELRDRFKKNSFRSRFIAEVALMIKAVLPEEYSASVFPILFFDSVENIGKRHLVLESGKEVEDEPVLISLVSKSGELISNREVMNEVAEYVTKEVKEILGSHIEVELEFQIDGKLFVFSDGKPIN